MSKHTPGPWRTSGREVVVNDPERGVRIVAVAYGKNHENQDATQLARQHLTPQPSATVSRRCMRSCWFA